MKLACLLAAVVALVAGCGPEERDPVDAALFLDRDLRDRTIDFRDTAIPDADLTDRPMRDGPVTCPNDGLEPNDVKEQATQLLRSDFQVANVGLCTDGDVDFYAVFLNAGDRMAFTVRFTHYDGDIVLDLLNFDGSLIQRSDFSSFMTGQEAVLLTDAQPQTKYLVKIYAKRRDDLVPYTLDIDLL